MGVRIATAALAAVCVAAHPALAQNAAPPPAPRFYDWTGIYVGANVAYGNATETVSTYNTTGVVAGGQFGWNYQIGQIVLGGEIDAAWSSLSANNGVSADFKIPWLSTARLRVGAAYDRIQYFLTGGAAVVNYTTTLTGISESSNRVGWVAGIGSESAVNRNLILQFEALYLQLTNVQVPGSTGTIVSGRVYEFVLRVGLSYKFNWRDY
jgi:outer membrane immunogenic protein